MELGASLGLPWPCCHPHEVGLLPEPFERLRSILDQRVATGIEPGSLCAIYRNGHLPFLHVTGDARPGQAATYDMITRLYSMSKPLIVATFLTLVDEGRLGLDDALADYIPSFREPMVQMQPPPSHKKTHVEKAWKRIAMGLDREPIQICTGPAQLPFLNFLAAGRGGDAILQSKGVVILRPGTSTPAAQLESAVRPITLRMLLVHTSGLGYGPCMSYQSPICETTRLYNELCRDTETGKVTNLKAWVDRLASIPLLFQPGERHLYSYSIDVLGHVIEVVAGENLRAAVKRRVLDPIGMKDTNFSVPPSQSSRIATLYRTLPQEKGKGKGRWSGADNKPKLVVLDTHEQSMWEDGFESLVLSGGGGIECVRGGMVGTLRDYLLFIEMTLCGGVSPSTTNRVLSAEVAHLAFENLLHKSIKYKPGEGWGLIGAVNVEKFPKGQISWGGVGGTRWGASREHGYAFVFLSQVIGSRPPVVAIESAIMDSLMIPSQSAPHSGLFLDR